MTASSSELRASSKIPRISGFTLIEMLVVIVILGILMSLAIVGVTAAIKSAKNVPLPLGQSNTFSCDKNSIPSPLFKAVICNSKVFVTPLASGEPTTYTVIDPGPLFAP